MRASAILFSLFLAGALSSPVKREVVYDDVIVYKYVTIIAGDESIPSVTASVTPSVTPSITPSVTPVRHHRHRKTTISGAPAPKSSTTIPPPLPPPPPPSSTASTTPPPPLTPAPAAEEPTPSPPSTPAPDNQPESDGSPLSDGVSLKTTVNKWRVKYGHSELEWDSQLERNALKTGVDGGGVNQIHQLNDGTMGQVITPGMNKKFGGDLGGLSCFELSYVAWLCEHAGEPELKSDGKDYCKLVSDNLHMYYNSDGHYKILNDKKYTKIGCAFADNPNAGTDTPYQGLWVCDVA